ncbi:MAG: 16S rRNA (guanine(527)-N(7))-methyltransferase RsmG [Muribaculaceae bacterium]|jgi:16S rRNA (guanine527-N7)-methyltransferase|nr:16S rRNA (guanine(527)-N(7))-methyltransferase RsmG [Muribaculaceae bacterium]
MDEILKYFPGLSAEQVEQFRQLGVLYPEWNEKINVISRKDIDNLYVNHILYSLGVTKVLDFKDGTSVLDFGTGGGFPGIPLAIMFPKVHFHLVDRTGKKIKVASDVAEKIGLKNVSFFHGDVNELKQKFDFVVSRAVMPIKEMIPMVRRLISRTCINALPNGLIYLKGGDVQAELESLKNLTFVTDLSKNFSEPFFETKKAIYVELL